MCGITGFIAERFPGADALRKMTTSLLHRGPDEGDIWLDAEARAGLGHRRLSILELSPAGHQPMHSACGRYVIVFNGEIYNHLELRQEIVAAGAHPGPWLGHSDTETLLAGFVHWGIKETLVRTVGMFAIAVWDRAERRLYLARDRLGEKPLYYGWVNGAFVFGSELKALRCYPGFDNPVDRDVVSLYMQFGYVPAPYGIYRHIYKLEPGCLLSMALADAATPPSAVLFAPVRFGTLNIERYWSLSTVIDSGAQNPVTDEREAIDLLETALLQAVKLQSVADVPLGAFLSGGIDSSTIVALMQAQASRPVRTFTIGFDADGFNEADYAKAVARHLGTEHTEMYVSPRQALEVIPNLPHLYCEPFADSSQIPTFLLSKIARQHVTVALSGDAGDELFGGYNRYFWAGRVWNRLSWLPPSMRHLFGALVQQVPAGAWDMLNHGLPQKHRVSRLGDKAHKLAYRMRTVNNLDDLYRSLVTEWPADSGVVPGARPLQTLLDTRLTGSHMAAAELRMMAWDTMTYLPDDILHKVDRAAMGVSLETRVPFLDHRIAELAWRLPLHMKMRDGQGKWALRQVLYRHVPRKLIERPKAGFGVPLNQWLRGPLRDWAEALLDAQRLQQSGFLNAKLVREKWRQHLTGSHDWTSGLWAALMFQAWLSKEQG